MCIALPCGYSSKTLSKGVAYADITLAILTFATLILLWEIICGGLAHVAPTFFTLSFIRHYTENYGCALSESAKSLLIAVGVFYCVGITILSLILLFGAHRRHLRTLQRWYYLSFALLVVRGVLCIVWMVTAPSGQKVGPFFVGFFNFLYNGTTMFIVRNHMVHIWEEDYEYEYERRKRLLS